MIRIILWLMLIFPFVPEEILATEQSPVADRYEIIEMIIVRKSASQSSSPVAVLSPDSFVEVWIKEELPKWIKLMIKTKRGGIEGYAQQSDWIRGARLQIQGDRLTAEKPQTIESASKGFRWGMALVGGFFYQTSRKFESESSGSVMIGAMSGISPCLEAFLQYSVTPEWIVQARINNRLVDQKGEATLSGSSSAVPTKVTIRQEFIGFGVSFRRYLSSLGWWDFGMEVDRGQSVKVEYFGESVEDAELTLPLFVLVQGSGGYDFMTTYTTISPQVRLSYAANLSTPTMLIDFLVAFSF